LLQQEYTIYWVTYKEKIFTWLIILEAGDSMNIALMSSKGLHPASIWRKGE
jgi:hypothetical protein